ncbi:MAG: SDR family NAD(P)-dependent oxidoreductase [Gammaproteobacteria bacterium]|nr:SDR family NAD(P)-dependent oxidoreductase [Gammaproteobacteria bacterium]
MANTLPTTAPAADCLQNKTILITGATGGLGSALARECAQLGATVILAGRDVPALESLYDELESAGAAQPAIFPINHQGATQHDYQTMATMLADEFGALHGLIHCAADPGLPTPLREYPVDIWTQVMTINFTSSFLLTRALLPLLDKTGDASIVLVTDPQQTAFWGAYGVSKSAVESMAKILADEIEGMKDSKGNPRVCVNTIYPGPMRTKLRAKSFAGELPSESPLPETKTAAIVHLLARTDPARHGTHVQAPS